MCVRESAGERESACVCERESVCVCVRVCACVSVQTAHASSDIFVERDLHT